MSFGAREPSGMYSRQPNRRQPTTLAHCYCCSCDLPPLDNTSTPPTYLLLAFEKTRNRMSNENTSFVTIMDGAHQLKETMPLVVSLIHPNTNEPQHFIFSDKNIYEMNSVTRPYGSFFVGSRVISNGALHIVTRMDPLYFVLHSLSRLQQQHNNNNGNHLISWILIVCSRRTLS